MRQLWPVVGQGRGLPLMNLRVVSFVMGTELLKELTASEHGEELRAVFGLDGPVAGPLARQTFEIVFSYIDSGNTGSIDTNEIR